MASIEDPKFKWVGPVADVTVGATPDPFGRHTTVTAKKAIPMAHIVSAAELLIGLGLKVDDLALRDGGLTVLEKVTEELSKAFTKAHDKDIFEAIVRYLTTTHGLVPRPAGMPLEVQLDLARDLLVINGIRFSGEVFRKWTETLPVGEWFRLESREDGVLTITTTGAPSHDFGFAVPSEE